MFNEPCKYHKQTWTTSPFVSITSWKRNIVTHLKSLTEATIAPISYTVATSGPRRFYDQLYHQMHFFFPCTVAGFSAYRQWNRSATRMNDIFPRISSRDANQALSRYRSTVHLLADTVRKDCVANYSMRFASRACYVRLPANVIFIHSRIAFHIRSRSMHRMYVHETGVWCKRLHQLYEKLWQTTSTHTRSLSLFTGTQWSVYNSWILLNFI